MFLAILCCLFIFLGMFIAEKYDFKKLSISVLFGLFIINCLSSVIPYVYSVLYKNYHATTFFYVLLSSVLGYLLIKLINFKYEYSDNVSIFGFTFVNTCLLISHRFNILFLVVNIVYYILLGIYIKKSKSWIFILSGCFLGLVFNMFNSWIIGYIYGINIGFILYFIISVYSIVFKNKEKYAGVSLIVGIIIALLGGIL